MKLKILHTEKGLKLVDSVTEEELEDVDDFGYELYTSFFQSNVKLTIYLKNIIMEVKKKELL